MIKPALYLKHKDPLNLISFVQVDTKTRQARPHGQREFVNKMTLDSVDPASHAGCHIHSLLNDMLGCGWVFFLFVFCQGHAKGAQPGISSVGTNWLRGAKLTTTQHPE